MWPVLEPDLLRLLDDTVAALPIDPTRVYLTGLSMGGFGSWDLGSRHPERFAAVAPICGWGDPKTVVALAHTPVWAFHGLKDERIPPSRTISLVEALRAAGGDVKLTTFPDAGHNCWERVYSGEDLYQWFLAHHTVPPPR
jgi:predicted peptidase